MCSYVKIKLNRLVSSRILIIAMEHFSPLIEKLKKKIVEKPLFVGIPFAIILALFFYWLFYARHIESTDNAYIRANLTPIACKVSGYVSELHVDDGALVDLDSHLIQIDPKEFQEQKNRAEGEVKELQSTIEQIAVKLELANLEISKSESRYVSAQAEYDRARKAYERSISLSKNDVVSQEKLEATKAQSAASESAQKEAKLDLDLFKLQRDNAQLEHSKAAHTLAIKKANLELADINLSYTKIKAPVKGTIGNRSCRVGQYIHPGMILMYIVPLDDVWVVANFKETQVSHMKIGQKVSVEVDAFPGVTFDGKIDSLSPASGAEFSLLPPDNATGNFTKIVQRIPVKITIEPKEGYRVVPGMSAYVKINTNS
jgi:membrane fusion protein (multidrug efflux system)